MAMYLDKKTGQWHYEFEWKCKRYTRSGFPSKQEALWDKFQYEMLIQRRFKKMNKSKSGPFVQYFCETKVRNILRQAELSGKVVRPDACSSCGKICKVMAHHSDYTKPLDVEWLCRKCHGLRHAHQVRKPNFTSRKYPYNIPERWITGGPND